MDKSFVIALAAAAIPVSVQAQILQGTGPYIGPGGFDRGFQSVQYCGNNPESWIRGSASLDKTSGLLNLEVQAETDSTTAGPKGRVLVSVRDAAGHDLADIQTDEFGRGGKPPGHAAITIAQKATTLPQSVTSRAASLYLVAQCTGSVGTLFGISDNQIGDLKVVITPGG